MADDLKRFRKVLHVREVEREITQGELAVKLNEEETILDRVNAITARRDDALAEFCSAKDGLVSPQQLWFERQNLDVIEKKLDMDKQELELCRADIEETKTVLLERHRNVQLMEKYVDKLKTRESKRAITAEQNNLDDITTMRFPRNFKREARA
jgi:flagellar export protein FliJ